MRFVDTSRIRSRFDVPIVLGDSTRLSADVYRPADPGRYPVIVTFTPYDNNRTPSFGHSAGSGPPAKAPSDRFKVLAAHGYVVLAVDARGKGDSDGTFSPFRTDAADGAEVVEWARTMPEASGLVGLFGTGYSGFSALATAARASVDAVAVWSPMGHAEGIPARGGAIRLDWLFWMHVLSGRSRPPADLPDWPGIFRHRPIADMHRVLGRDDVEWPDWVARGRPDDDQWAALQLDEGLAGSTAPALLVSGWWDSALPSTLSYWDRLRRDGGHRLIIGPWDGTTIRVPSSHAGGVDWGPSALVDPDELLLEWFGAHLPGPAATTSPEIRLFVTGRNEWRDVDSLGSGTSTSVFLLSSGGRANTRLGDGTLETNDDLREQPDLYDHDPRNPVPWQPDRPSFSRTSGPALTLDTSFATARDDVLVYQAAPVDRPRLLTGRPRVVLWAETDAPDTDWVVAVEDLFPGGTRSLFLTHGIVRARSLEEFVPGRPAEYVIDLTDVHHELLPGHSIRVLVSSSLFPLYVVNHGDPDYAHGTTSRIAHQVVHHDSRHPSRLEVSLG